MKEDKRKYTVYMHECPNGKKYIGCTKLQLNDRWRNGNGYKRNPRFYPDIMQFGWDNIKHCVLETNLDYESACDLEKDYIEKFNTIDTQYGYNISNFKGTGGVPVFLGRHHSVETKGKMSRSASNKIFTQEHKDNISKGKQGCFGEKNGFYGKHHSEESKNKISASKIGKCTKPVSQYSLNGKCIKEYDGAKQASIETGLDSSAITRCCKNKAKTVGGYKWSYTNLDREVLNCNIDYIKVVATILPM